MGRKVAFTTAAALVVVLSVVLVGGQVGGGGYLWWGTREPIYIYGDDEFTIENGVMSGSGTAGDPYVIEGWRVDSPRADYGIYVDHTTAHFVIRDCVIERTRLAGIYFNTVRNGCIDGVQIGLADTAVYLLDSTHNVFAGNVIAESRYGMVMGANSKDNLVAGNAFLGNGMNAYDPNGWNLWYEPCRGNYWSDYDGGDHDGDGVGDVAYCRVYDRYPLVDPPVEWTRVAPAGLGFAGNRVTPDGSLIVTSQTPITLSALDPGSGVAAIHYAIDEADWQVYAGPIYITGDDGPRSLVYYGIDYLGNVEPKQAVALFLDNHPPETVLEVGAPMHVDERGTWMTSKSPVTLRLVRGSTYGETEIYYRIDGRGWRLYSRPFTIEGPDGPRHVTFYARNASGVVEPTKSIVVYKDDAAPSTRGARTSPSIEVRIGEPAEETPPEPPPAVEPPTVEEPGSEETVPVVEEEAPVDTSGGEAHTDGPVEETGSPIEENAEEGAGAGSEPPPAEEGEV